MKANQNIRKCAKMAGVKHWEIAHHLGVSEQTLLRWLRLPLASEKEERILRAIVELSRGD